MSALAACSLFEEPERFYDYTVRPPTVTTLDISQLRPGQQVAGILHLTLDLDSLDGRVEYVQLHIDDRTQTRDRPPYSFTIDTGEYPDGPHGILATVQVRDAGIGLLGMIGMPAVILETTLVFDQTPPTVVDVAGISWEGSRPRLTWVESGDSNFRSYIIVRRSSTVSEYVRLLEGTPVDTIYDQSLTTYLGEAMPEEFGWSEQFRVGVSNGAEIALSPWVEAAFGHSWALEGDLLRARSSPHSSTIYAEFYPASGSDDDRLLVAVSSISKEVVRSVNIASRWGPSASLMWLTQSPDGDRLILRIDGISPKPHIVVLDAASFVEQARFEVPNDYGTAVPRADGRLYVTQRGALVVLDGLSGEELSRVDSFGPRGGILAVSVDGRDVYMGSYSPSWKFTLSRVNADASTLSIETERVFEEDWPEPFAFALLPNGRLLVQRPEADWLILDPMTLETTGTFAPSNGSEYRGSRLAAVRPNGIFIISEMLNPDGRSSGVVRQFDTKQFSELGMWKFRFVPVGIIADRSAEVVHAYHYEHGGATSRTIFWPLPR